jgi:uncharacterized membrane protein
MEGKMRTPASIAGHPIHPMLIVFPVALWISALVCDLILVVAPGDVPQIWFTASYMAIIGGLIGAIAAAFPGAIDLVSLRNTPVRRIAVAHMAINLVVVALFVANAWVRRGGVDDMTLPLTLSVIGVVLMGISGWLGGSMVHVHRVGVEEPERAIVPDALRSAPRAASADRMKNEVPENVT